MRIRTKFFSIATGILTVSIGVFFLFPRHVIKEGINQATAQVSQAVQQSEAHQFESQAQLLSNLFARITRHINVFFLLFDQIPQLQERLKFSSSSALQWYTLAYLTSENPNLGFVEIDSLDETRHLVIAPAETTLYTFTLAPSPFPGVMKATYGTTTYLGIPVKKGSKHPNFILMPMSEDAAEVARWQTALAAQKFEWPQEYNVKHLFVDPKGDHEKAVIWYQKTQLLRQLAPLVATAWSQEGSTVPEGIITIDSTGNAYGVLSAEGLRQKPMLDAAAVYTAHQPSVGAPPIAQTIYVVASAGLQHLFVTGTFKAPGFYMTLGLPIDWLAEDLALWTKNPILIEGEDHYWMLTYQEGVPTLTVIDPKIKQGKTLNVGGNSYAISSLVNFGEQRLVFYALTPPGTVSLFTKLMTPIAASLASRLAWTFFVIAIAVVLLIIMAAIIGAFVNAIIPIRILAKATHEVSAGRYSSVVLPKMGKRNDEMAELVDAFKSMVQGLQEKEKVRSVLDKVVSKAIAEEILRSGIQLGGEDREVSVLFGDIRGFTRMSEKMTPQQTITMLNTCMTKITRIIEEQKGVLDKYVGDEVMAIYGAPVSLPQHAVRALSTAVLMLQAIDVWNKEREQQNEPPIHMGFGIHAGLVVAGNMGAEDRLNYTVLGAGVNLAARLCQNASSSQILISEATLNQPGVRETFSTEALPPLALKGIAEPIPVYSVKGFTPLQKNTSEHVKTP